VFYAVLFYFICLVVHLKLNWKITVKYQQ